MSDDLHARLKTVIEERLAVAKAATPGPWAIWRDLDFQGFFTVGDEAGVVPDGEFITKGECNPTAHVYVEEDARFIAAHDPAWAIRQHQAALLVLERHRPDRPDRHECATCCDDSGYYLPWPCAEALDLADVYGVPIDLDVKP